MTRFLAANQGLASRFGEVKILPDYSPEEMEQMFKDEEAGLAKAISDFYKDAKYFGD